MSAVSALAATQRSLATTENQITTGLRVSSAKDNAAYWSIATAMKTRIGEMQAVNDGLDLASSVISTATSALNTIVKITQGIAEDLVTAQTAGVDLTKVQADIASKQRQLQTVAQSASFNGVNLLAPADAYGGSAHFVHDYSKTQSQFTNGFTGTATDNLETNVENGAYYSHSVQENQATFVSPGILDETPSAPPTQYDASTSFAHFDDVPIVLSLDSTGAAQIQDVNNATTAVMGAFDGGNTIFRTNNFSDGSSTSSTVDEPYKADQFNGAGSGALGAMFVPVADQYSQVVSVITMDVTANGSTPYYLSLLSQGTNVAIEGLTKVGSNLAGLQNQVDGSKQINTAIINALTSGVGSLVDADMNEASTRLNALQTQQQLGTQALSVANDNSQMILKLFGG